MYRSHPIGPARSGLSRRTLLGRAFATAGGALLARGIAVPAPTSASDLSPAADVISTFYRDVATYQYRNAYDLLGHNLQEAQPYDDFVNGYGDTAFVQTDIVGTASSGNEATVGVSITAWHNDRTVHAYGGGYTLAPVGDGWRIVGASIAELAPPGDVPRLMRISDIVATFGQPTAGAGHRYFSLLATNTSKETVLAAGVPHLTLIDRDRTVVMESSPAPTQAVLSVVLAPGDTANAQFEWSNWCGGSLTFPLDLRVAIPGDANRVTLRFTEDSGAGQPPPCLGASEPSIFTAQAFQPADS